MDIQTNVNHQMHLLEQLIQQNNEGVALLTASNGLQSRRALRLIHGALTTAVDLDESFHATPAALAKTETVLGDISDVCLAVSVPIPAAATSLLVLDDGAAASNSPGGAFYFYRRGLCLKPLQELCHMIPCPRRLIRTCLLALLMNASLVCYQLGAVCLQQRSSHSGKTLSASARTTKAHQFFTKAMHLYSQIIELTGLADATTPPCRFTSFVAIAALSNCSWVCLELGLIDQAMQAQSELMPMLNWHSQQAAAAQESGNTLLTDSDQVMLNEFSLNHVLLSTTGYFSMLPAAAA